MNGPYSTTPLDLKGRSIRLLRICPNSATETIECELHCVPLADNRAEYIALSYTWGEDISYDHIRINGKAFPVRENLWKFLALMRNRGQKDYFWIDAICINQSSDHERNHQVQMMRDIYSNAQSVSIWLGDGNHSSGLAMSYLSTRIPLSGESVETVEFWSPRDAEAILEMCKEPYWARVWIIQEVMLAKRISIYYGSQVIAWHAFSQFFQDLWKLAAQKLLEHISLASNVRDSPADNIVLTKFASHIKLRPLSELLILYSGHDATDPRDKIYALHGLAEDVSDIPVDYSITNEELLRKVLLHILKRLSFADKKEAGRLGAMTQFWSTCLNTLSPSLPIDAYADFWHATVAAARKELPSKVVANLVRDLQLLDEDFEFICTRRQHAGVIWHKVVTSTSTTFTVLLLNPNTRISTRIKAFARASASYFKHS